ncbi:MAG: hypothetical protein L6W00_19930 [Lentisphaeria bacterium]|nr:MAG: hypothetical protein L6W00_19930 [Lentisphaeria bacterium]
MWRADDVPEELHEMLTVLGEEYPIADFGRGLKLKFRRVEAEETLSRVTRTPGRRWWNTTLWRLPRAASGLCSPEWKARKQLRSARWGSCWMLPAIWSCGRTT